MTAFATPADLAAIWRPLTDEEATRADQWLAVASLVLRDRFKTIDQRIAAGTLNPALAGHVTVMMVKRVLQARGPDDPTTEQIGEARRSWDPPSDAASELTVTAGEARLLAPASNRPRTINMAVGVPGP